jgi:vacuolar-type H+-ATPase catalytic subunit A/Vma1
MRTNEHAEFLRRQAAALRDLALRSPRLAEALRRLADQLDEMADEVAGNRGSPTD